MLISFDEYLSTLLIIELEQGIQVNSSTSKGNQPKWYLPNSQAFVKEAFFCQGKHWRDYICEELAYNVGIQFGFDIAVTKACLLSNKKPGSYSKSFLGSNESFESFHNMQKSCSNIYIYIYIYIKKDFMLLEPAEIFKALCNQYKETCSLDAEAYLSDMFLLDYLMGNEDRHLNNFGAVFDYSLKQYRFAPIFDNGLSLLEHSNRYEDMSAEVALYTTNQRPFNTRFDIVYKQIPHITNGTALRMCDLRKLVFPSQKAYEYFQKAAEVLSIPLIGEPIIVKE